MGVARNIVCASQFRRCRDYEAPKQPLCPWVCGLLVERCPEETELIANICSVTSDEKSCSSGQRLLVVLGALLAGLMIVI